MAEDVTNWEALKLVDLEKEMADFKLQMMLSKAKAEGIKEMIDTEKYSPLQKALNELSGLSRDHLELSGKLFLETMELVNALKEGLMSIEDELEESNIYLFDANTRIERLETIARSLEDNR